MYRPRHACILVIASLLIALAPLALAEGTRDLGDVDFPTSGSEAAQEHFIRGLLYLHSFEYADARREMRRAQEIEPGFAMAYWGEAMTYNHPIWLEEDVASARAALARLAPDAASRRAKAPTEREKRYLEAVEILFGDGDKERRDRAYAEAMKGIMEDYPGDLEAKAFYALALMGTCHEGREVPVYMWAAALADEVFDQNPRHPGAAHYLIHATDDAAHAPLGLRAARAYARIAPAAGHALHMPSHIFLALGMWPETAASNRDSWNAVAARVQAEGGGVDGYNYHALLWWHYALLQSGQHQKAVGLLAVMAANNAQSGSRRTRSHLALMRAAHRVDAGGGDLPPAPATDELGPSARASVYFTDGLLALDEGDLETAAARHQTLVDYLDELGQEDRRGYSSGYTRVGSLRTAPAEIMARELGALLARARGDDAEALRLLGEAASIEAETPFGFGPPVPAKPAYELLGEVLLELGRADEAKAQFEVAIGRTPGRAKTLLGLARAAQRSGDAELAARAYDDLRRAWSQADMDLPERAEVGLPGPGARTPAEASER